MASRDLALSWAALLSRRFGSRAIVVVGVATSLYAVGLFIAGTIAPDSTKASHDAVLKVRWSSPAPDKRIIIIDVDEKSLARMSDTHGRWPWSRDVLAEGLQKLNDAGARAVLLNILVADPDKRNTDADAVLEFVSSTLKTVAYPLVRLNPENDVQSTLRLDSLAGAVIKPSAHPPTVAAILPLFPSMLPTAGVANQRPDSDGITRRYPVVWDEDRFSLPSIVQQMLVISGRDIRSTPLTITLNWRNKKGRYQRISYSDIFEGKLAQAEIDSLRGAYLVIGVSAPGIGQTRPTAVSQLEDDNEILATALDDVLNNTHLRVIPGWLALVVNLASIWALAGLSVAGVTAKTFNRGFVLAQSALGSITLLSASYTNVLLDLTECMSFALFVFAAIKIVYSLDDGWSRGSPGYRRAAGSGSGKRAFLVGYKDSQVSPEMAKRLQRELEALVGVPNVVRVDDLFGGGSFLKSAFADYSCQIVFMPNEKVLAVMGAVSKDMYRELVTVDECEVDEPWTLDDAALVTRLSPLLLRNCASVIEV